MLPDNPKNPGKIAQKSGHAACYSGGMSTPSEQLATLKAAYDANASYDLNQSAAEASAFIVACRKLQLLLPKRVSKGGRGQGEEVELDPATLRAQIVDAQTFLSQYRQATAPRRCFSIEHFRD